MSDARAEPPTRRRWYLHADSDVYGPYDQATITGMIARKQVLRDDKVHVEGGSEWLNAELDPTLGPIFPKQPVPVAKPSAQKGKLTDWMRFIPIMLLTLIIAWIAWPYYAVFSLMNAVRDGDIPTLEKRVDWVGLRQALRGDLNARLLQGLSGKKGDASGAMASGFAAMLGPAIVNNLIDGYVTPQAIAALARDKNNSASQKDSETASDEVKTAVSQVRRFDWRQVKYAFFVGSPFSFEVDVLPRADRSGNEPVNLIFNWNGDWRLVKVNIPPDAGTADKKRAVDQANSDQTSKPSEPSPIEIKLLSKRFKAADYKDNDYQAAIQIELSITNTTAQGIRAFEGTLTFTDLLDNEIFSTKIAINDPIAPGLSVSWNGVSNYNQFMDSHQSLKNADFANLKTRFSPRKILYADGNTKVFE